MMARHYLRGQISLELMVTLGTVLAFTVPVVFLLLSVSSVGYEKAAKDQADASARSLADSINTVYSQGNNAKRVVLVNAPSNVRNISIGGNEVVVKVKTSAGDYDGASPVFANVTDTTITGQSGLFSIAISNVNGVVHVEQVMPGG
jgi:uncharacterized protein (UPF0333 family)